MPRHGHSNWQQLVNPTLAQQPQLLIELSQGLDNVHKEITSKFLCYVFVTILHIT